MEVDLDMATNIIETLPWIDYREVFEKVEARARDEERAKWEAVVADKDATIAERDTAITKRDAAIAEQAAIIAELRARLDGGK
jgi:uncharacterized protein (DUF3084 family)